MQMGEIYSYLSNLLGKPAPQPEPLPAEARRGFSNQRISCSRLMALAGNRSTQALRTVCTMCWRHWKSNFTPILFHADRPFPDIP